MMKRGTKIVANSMHDIDLPQDMFAAPNIDVHNLREYVNQLEDRLSVVEEALEALIRCFTVGD